MSARARAGALFLCAILAALLLGRGERIRPVLRDFYYAKILGTPIINVLPRVAVDCAGAVGPRVMVALAFGQSNAANYGTPRFTPGAGVYNIHEGRCYEALDPMIGASGDGGSVWTRLGQLLVAQHRYDRVYFISIAQASSNIAQWVDGGPYVAVLGSALTAARAAGFEITHVFWHQGESDADEPDAGTDYARALAELFANLRGYGITAPIFVSVASYCHGNANKGVQGAQRLAVDPANGIFPGPDTDTLVSSEYRRDDCHFSGPGLAAFAALWSTAIAAADDYVLSVKTVQDLR